MPDQINPKDIRRVGTSDETSEQVMLAKSLEDTRRARFRKAELRARIAALYSEGQYISAIIEQTSEEFNLDNPLSVSEVQTHIKAQVNFWRKEGLKHIDDKQALVLATIDNIEQLATNAYFASMQGRMTYHYEKQIERQRAQKSQDKQRERILYSDQTSQNLLDEEMWEETTTIKEGRDVDDILNNDAPNGRIEENLVTISEKIKDNKRFEEASAGDPRFLSIMLDCVDKRCKLWGLYIRDKEGQNPDSEFAKMSDKDKQDRLGVLLIAAQQRLKPIANALADAAPLGGSNLLESGDIETTATTIEDEEKTNDE